MNSETYQQVILRKANQHVQARLNVAVPTLDSSKTAEGLIRRQRAKIREMARQTVLRAKREEAEELVKAEGRPPTDDDFQVEATPGEIHEAAVLIAGAVVSATKSQLMVDQQILEGLRRGV